MTRYFFDISDGDHWIRDCEGLEMADTAAARVAAIDVLPDIARDMLPDGDRREMVARVRTENGHFIFQATLSLRTEWLDGEEHDPH